MKKFLLHIKKHQFLLIWLVLLSSLIIWNLFDFIPNIIRLFKSILMFIKNILVYMRVVFLGDLDVELFTSIDLIDGDTKIINILFPYDLKFLKIQILTILRIMITKKQLIFYIAKSSDFLFIFFRILTILLMIGIILYLLLDIYCSPHEFDIDKVYLESKPKKVYLKIKSKTFIPVKNYIKSFINYTKEHDYLFKIAILLVAFKIKLLSLIIESLGFIFAFCVTFNLTALWNQITAILIDLLPVLIKIPLIVYLTVGTIIFIKRLIVKADDEIRHKHSILRILVAKEMTTTNFIYGPPGAGKDLCCTSLSIIAESNLRYDLLKVIQDINSEYPEFPFKNVELEIDYLKEKGLIVNWAQAETHIINYVNRIIENDEDLFFNYKWKEKSNCYYNELKEQSLFEAVVEYAHAYFMYSMNTPLLASNYAIRLDNIRIDSGHFVMFNDDFLSHDNRLLNEFSSYSHIYNFDWCRIYKKMDPSDSESLDDGFVTVFTEYDKERLNQNTSKGLDRKSDEANQLNDGVNDFWKTRSHINTIRNKRYGQSFINAQRTGALNADNLETFEFAWNITEKSEESSTLRHLYIPLTILGFIHDFTRSTKLKLKNNRSDDTLIIYFINKINSLTYTLLLRIKNRWGFFNMTMTNQYHKTIDVPVLYKFSYADRYNTAALSSLYIDNLLNNTKGIETSPMYYSSTASVEELLATKSYFYNKFYTSVKEVNSTRSKENSVAEEPIIPELI